MPAEPAFLGDFLITFGGEVPRLPARFSGAPWQPAASGPGWQVWTSPPSPDWKGFPLHRLEIGGWRVYSLGEFEPSAAAALELSAQVAAFPGRCLVFAWEERARRWHVWTDRFATLHAYRAARAVGTFSPAVAAFTPRRLDWPALAGFFGFGFFPADRTHFEDVGILRPATHLVLDERGGLVLQERYWQWVHQPDRTRSYGDTVEEFGRVFNQVMSGALQDGRVAIPLSGGLDSRCTLAPVARADAASSRCWSYSYGYSPDSVETRIAGQVAAARGLPFQAYTIQPYLFDQLDRLLAWTEGFQDITQARQAFVRDEIAAHADHLIGALWGDVWLDDMGLAGAAGGTLPAEAIAAHALRKMLKNGRAWLLDHLIRPRLPGLDLEKCLQDWVRPEMAALEGIGEPDFRVKAFKTWQWSFRWSLAPVRVFQSAAWPRLIFYDARLADFFCTVPSAFLPGRRLQIDYLKRFAPDLARITWQVYDANLYEYVHFNTWQLPRRAVKKALRVLSRKQVLQRNWEVQFLSPAGRVRLEDGLLRPGLRLHELVSPVEIRALLNGFFAAPDAANGYSVSMLMTFSAWLERYGG